MTPPSSPRRLHLVSSLLPPLQRCRPRCAGNGLDRGRPGLTAAAPGFSSRCVESPWPPRRVTFVAAASQLHCCRQESLPDKVTSSKSLLSMVLLPCLMCVWLLTGEGLRRCRPAPVRSGATWLPGRLDYSLQSSKKWEDLGAAPFWIWGLHGLGAASHGNEGKFLGI
ncbi:uncharacterized protein [Triticum aestivum]|uniref:uncharacterized protein n=1 Tax=Triticum aestivum TaxID=4565 RepID=UPI001D03394E|nr:uncharacterized protein LOC123045256 [Triticum aestivum]